MKNQNDLIVSIVVSVLAIGLISWFWFGKREPEVKPKPTEVPLTKVSLPPGTVSYSMGLPNGGSGGGNDAPAGFGGGEGAARGGQPPGPPGPPPGAARGRGGTPPGE